MGANWARTLGLEPFTAFTLRMLHLGYALETKL